MYFTEILRREYNKTRKTGRKLNTKESTKDINYCTELSLRLYLSARLQDMRIFTIKFKQRNKLVHFTR